MVKYIYTYIKAKPSLHDISLYRAYKEDITQKIKEAQLNNESVRAYKSWQKLLTAVINDPTIHELACLYGTTDQQCIDCGDRADDKQLRPSQFSAPDTYEWVCNRCEENREVEYFGTLSPPCF